MLVDAQAVFKCFYRVHLFIFVFITRYLINLFVYVCILSLAMGRFAVIETRDADNELECSAVPDNWLLDDQTVLWPAGNEGVSRKAMNRQQPDESWLKYPYVLLKGYIGTLSNIFIYFNIVLLCIQYYFQIPMPRR